MAMHQRHTDNLKNDPASFRQLPEVSLEENCNELLKAVCATCICLIQAKAISMENDKEWLHG